MADGLSTPTTITGKVKLRTPTQAEALSSRYVFLNLQNAEPNLGVPNSPGIKDEFAGDPGYRYALLSNNVQSPSGWRVWAYDNPKIAAYSKENSIALGSNPNPINDNSFVYSNYTYSYNNIYNSQSFEDNTFNVFALSGIYLFDATTIGDPASATSFIITDTGKVGINTDNPNELLTVAGNISATGNLVLDGAATLGNNKNDTHTVRGTLRIGDSFTAPMLFGANNTSYDVNLYRHSANNLKTDDNFTCNTLSAVGGVTCTVVNLTNTATLSSTTTPLTASGEFIVLNINGVNKAIRLWEF